MTTPDPVAPLSAATAAELERVIAEGLAMPPDKPVRLIAETMTILLATLLGHERRLAAVERCTPAGLPRLSRTVAAPVVVPDDAAQDDGGPPLRKQAEHYECDECGAHVAVDEDGCCVTCGEDATVVPCGTDRECPAPPAQLNAKPEPRRWRQLPDGRRWTLRDDDKAKDGFVFHGAKYGGWAHVGDGDYHGNGPEALARAMADAEKATGDEGAIRPPEAHPAAQPPARDGSPHYAPMHCTACGIRLATVYTTGGDTSVRCDDLEACDERGRAQVPPACEGDRSGVAPGYEVWRGQTTGKWHFDAPADELAACHPHGDEGATCCNTEAAATAATWEHAKAAAAETTHAHAAQQPAAVEGEAACGAKLDRFTCTLPWRHDGGHKDGRDVRSPMTWLAEGDGEFPPCPTCGAEQLQNCEGCDRDVREQVMLDENRSACIHCVLVDRDRLTTEAAALRARVAGLETAAQEMIDLFARSAPLAWVANNDMDGAGEWEKDAVATIAKAATRAPAAAPPPQAEGSRAPLNDDEIAMWLERWTMPGGGASGFTAWQLERVRATLAEVVRIRAARSADVARRAAEERSRIVEYLRGLAESEQAREQTGVDALMVAAIDVDRGEHAKEMG